MNVRRCAKCCESWPDKPEFYDCPGCGLVTARLDVLSVRHGDVADETSEAIFERYCAARDRRRWNAEAA